MSTTSSPSMKLMPRYPPEARRPPPRPAPATSSTIVCSPSPWTTTSIRPGAEDASAPRAEEAAAGDHRRPGLLCQPREAQALDATHGLFPDGDPGRAASASISRASVRQPISSAGASRIATRTPATLLAQRRRQRRKGQRRPEGGAGPLKGHAGAAGERTAERLTAGEGAGRRTFQSQGQRDQVDERKCHLGREPGRANQVSTAGPVPPACTAAWRDHEPRERPGP